MDADSLKTIIIILSSAFLASGGALITVVTWVVLKTFKQNEEIKAAMIEEFRKFGQQLAAVREFVKDEIHSLEKRIIEGEGRIAAIESWQRGMNSAANVANKAQGD